MPQLKTNTVTVTNGSNSVVGSGTAWLTGPNPVTVGAYLIISDENGGSPTVYEVQTIPSDTSITLTTNWAGVTGTYNAVIHIDFLPNGVPQLTSGDLETVAVINRAHKILGDGEGVAAATTTTRGTVEKATQPEMDAGTADKFPSSAEVKAFFDSNTGTVASKDYEEGTWSPVVSGATVAGTYTPGTAQASYVKVGKLVSVQGYVSWSAHTGSGSIYLSLPFTSSDKYAAVSLGEVNGIADLGSGNIPMGYVLVNSAVMVLTKKDIINTPTIASGLEIGASGAVLFSATYRTQ